MSEQEKPSYLKDQTPSEGAAHEFYASEGIADAPNLYWHNRRAVVNQIKELAERIQTTDLSATDLDALGHEISHINQRLDDHERLLGRKAWLESKKFGDQGVLHSESTSLVGPANALSPELSIWFEEGSCKGTVEFNWLHEGNPSICHGGFVAAVYDEFLGTAQILSGKTGMTAYLTTRYLKPTPLNKKLTLTCELGECDERKTNIISKMFDGDVQLSSCEALFITPQKKNDPFKDIQTDDDPIG